MLFVALTQGKYTAGTEHFKFEFSLFYNKNVPLLDQGSLELWDMCRQ